MRGIRIMSQVPVLEKTLFGEMQEKLGRRKKGVEVD